MVARTRRRKPHPVSRRVQRRLDCSTRAHTLTAAGAGCGSARGFARMKVSIAVPTGMLLSGALRLLSHAGVVRLSAAELGRRLLVERSSVRVILVRPADVPAYVDHGAADLGIVGKDVLWESNGSHYELVDLTASGRTLRENRLRIVATLGSSTARLSGNQASLKTRTDAVQAMVARLREAAKDGD